MYVELLAFVVALTELTFVATLWRTRLVCMMQAAWYISWLLVKFLLKSVLLPFFFLCDTSCQLCMASSVWPVVDFAMLNAQLQVILVSKMSEKACNV